MSSLPRAAHPHRSARAAAQHREPGAPFELVRLFKLPTGCTRAKDGHIEIAGREVSIVMVPPTGVHVNGVTKVIKRKRGWTGYVAVSNFDHRVFPRVEDLWTTGPLPIDELDITWTWGWRTKEAQALRASVALR